MDNDKLEISFHPHPYIRRTSQEAWESVRSSGWATRTAKQAYNILFERGPLTLLELEHIAAESDGRKPRGRSESNVVRRLYDLRDNGLVYTLEQTRTCLISRKYSVLWDVTPNIAPSERCHKVKCCPRCGFIL